nr:MipA/OmpV family protein [Kordiimonas marina]
MVLLPATLPFSASLGGTAHAQSLTDRFSSTLEVVQEGLDVLWPDELKKRGVQARLGVGLGWLPEYVGSSDLQFRALPIVDIRYKDIWRLNGTTFTYNVYKKNHWEIGPLLNLHFGRKQSKDRVLHGMGDIPPTLQVGAFARYSTSSMLAFLDIRQSLGAGQGFTVNATVGHGIMKIGDFAAGFGIKAKWYSKQAMQTNFGVTAEQAANSEVGLSIFHPRAGFSEVSGNLLGVYRVNDYTRLFGLVSVGKLVGDAGNSPLTGGEGGFGSNTITTVGGAVVWQF